MITISNYRSSFAELQVGDQFLTRNSGWNCSSYNLLTIIRLTPKYFIRGYGNLINGKHEYENAYRRDNGQKVGRYHSDPDATLPTPELVAEINQDITDRNTRNELKNLELSNLTIEQARQVVDLVKSFSK
jgi:hypothetical protein